MEKRFVYADNAATTKVSDKAFEAMLPYLKESYGNPSGVYSLGMEASRGVLGARQQVQKAIGAAKVGEIFFTSCGSEADNWAIRGAAKLGERSGKRHIITTAIEHHAVINTCKDLEKNGFEVTYLKPDEQGFITARQVEDAIREDTALVSVMAVNNEIGTIQPIAEIGKVCREKKVLFHTDAVQAIGHIPVDVKAMNVDMLSLSGHKFHAPKGVGALYIKGGTDIAPLIFGGSQERGRRAGTENVPAIAAMGEAITEAVSGIEEKNAAVKALCEPIIDGILSQIPCSRLNGSRENRVSGNLNFSFRGIEGESLLLLLDMHGICASSGSACAVGSSEPSHVLTAIGLEKAAAHGSVRLTLNEENTADDAEYILKVLPEAVKELRRRSPLWQRICENEGIEDYTKK
ncbi:MAG: cysteine desulfurase NifS [Ruminococcus sp.]|nr:cysteine desulfurase NifS [Ruminococcus sp.]